jgi:DNA topoisomerase I
MSETLSRTLKKAFFSFCAILFYIMHTLVIVESPAKAKTIEKYLGKGYTVEASVGHIRDLPKSQKNAIDIEKGFIPHYEIVEKKKKTVEMLKKAVKKSDAVLLATDPDREGEAIAWHLFEALSLKKKPTKRIAFNEITKDAVQYALSHPREIDQNLRKAQEARRVLDRLVGYELSGLIWKKVRYGLSAGRVQSPALRIIMERERSIRLFLPEEYFILSAHLSKEKENKKDALIFTCTKEIKKEEEASLIVEKGRKAEWSLFDIKEQERVRNPLPPFTTSTLQQTASTRLGFSPSQTMALAQKLYENGHITYMRTDSLSISKSAQENIKETILKEYGKEFLEERVYKTKNKNAQEAHEAIRPTLSDKKIAGNTEEQKRLYDLIRKRTLSSSMKSARLLRTTLIAKADTDIPLFSTTGSRIISLGWLKCDVSAKGDDVLLPLFSKNEKLSLKELDMERKETTPPNRYTEAGLIKELEKRGIGRPSTYASIMKNLIERAYVEKKGKTLFPTDTGDVVSSFLEKYFSSYISDTFTAEMEEDLDDIAEGKREYEKTLKKIYTPLHKDILEKENIEKITNLGEVEEKFLCPLCESKMVYKLGRGGIFMSCSLFPECHGARTKEGNVVESEKPLGIYPETGESIFIFDGRFGPYIQVGDGKEKKKKDIKRASIPKEKNSEDVTLEDALLYLALPRILGVHPETGETISANNGRFGPYIVHQKDFRSLKEDDVYTINLSRALEILKEEKKSRWGKKTHLKKEKKPLKKKKTKKE